ncbi:SigE family RNA polymerase sigma factor [Nocardioides dubius]|uniref:SigE family RNA polymerase sigma factor n=1 Tax=Nocardioides dubius TaxID=317019 RepID=A0ABN1TUN2_9ACTN
MNRDHDFIEFATARSAALYRSALVLCGDRHLAEDLVQECLAKLFLVWGRRGIDNPASYAHATLVRTFLSARRRRSWSERPAAQLPEVMAAETDVGLRLDLVAALRELTPTDRAVLVLRFLEDRTVQQTAEAIGISAVAVRSRTMRALARIRPLLDDEAEPLGDRA